MNSPIVLFTFNRLNLLKKTIKCLQRNYLAIETDLVVFSDGHKDEKNLEEIIAIRSFLKKVNGFKSILIIEREKNLGSDQKLQSKILANFFNFLLTSIYKIVHNDPL